MKNIEQNDLLYSTLRKEFEKETLKNYISGEWRNSEEVCENINPYDTLTWL